MSTTVEILKKTREFIVNDDYVFVCPAIKWAAHHLGKDPYGKLCIDLRREVSEMIDGMYSVDIWLGIPVRGPIVKQYRVAIIDVLIARHSK